MYPDHLQKYIPPDFDLKNYENTAHMLLVDWAHNLSSRKSAYRCYLNNDYEFKEYSCKSEIESEKSLYEFVSGGLDEEHQYLRDVLNNLESGAKIDSNAENFFQAGFVEGTTHTTSIVSEMNYANLISLHKQFITEQHLVKFANIEFTPILSCYEDNLGELNEPVGITNEDNEVDYAWLKLDMSCSDSEINSAFKRWLKDYRVKEKNVRRREHKLKLINETAFRNWHLARVLPYIDLVTWNFYIRQNITNKIIGDILFPEPKMLSDKTKIIEDTTKPYAQKLTSPRFMRRALKVIVDERRKKNKENSSGDNFL